MVIHGDGKTGASVERHRTTPQSERDLIIHRVLHLVFRSPEYKKRFAGTPYAVDNLSPEKLKTLLQQAAYSENGFLGVVGKSVLIGLFHPHPYLKGEDATVILWFSLDGRNGFKVLEAFERQAIRRGIKRVRLGVSTGRVLERALRRRGYHPVGGNFIKET